MERQLARRWHLVGLAFVALVLLAGCTTDPGAGDPVDTDTVRIPGPWVFEPASIRVDNGTTVSWVNDGGQPHTVTFAELGIDETIEPGETLELTFSEPGVFAYTCRFHPPDMDGQVTVTSAADGASTNRTDGD